jgi:hypothetical protein
LVNISVLTLGGETGKLVIEIFIIRIIKVPIKEVAHLAADLGYPSHIIFPECSGYS